MSPDDPWTGGGGATRAEVREIFARHAAAGADAGGPAEPVERRSALPGFLSLPARGWAGTLDGPIGATTCRPRSTRPRCMPTRRSSSGCPFRAPAPGDSIK